MIVKSTPEQTVNHIKNALLEISALSLREKVQMHDHSFGAIFNKNDVNSSFHRMYIPKYLEEQSIVVFDGDHIKTAYQWRVETEDFSVLAHNVYDYCKKKQNEYLQRLKEKKEKGEVKKKIAPVKDLPEKKEMSSKPVIIPSDKQFSLKDRCYILHNGKIHEGEIKGMEIGEDNRVHYKVRISILNVYYTNKERIARSDIYHTVEGLLNKLKLSTVVYNPDAKEPKGEDFIPQMATK